MNNPNDSTRKPTPELPGALPSASGSGSEAWPTQHSGNRFEYRILNGEWQVYGNGLLHVCMCNCESTADMITRALNKQMPQNDLDQTPRTHDHE